jgi:hypothetical protein
MALKYLKSYNTGSISSGSSYTLQFTADEDYHVKHLFFSDRNKTSLSATQVWVEFGVGNVITKDFASASVFGNSPLNALDVDVTIPKGSVITVKVTNNEGTAINVDIMFEIVS